MFTKYYVKFFATHDAISGNVILIVFDTTVGLQCKHFEHMKIATWSCVTVMRSCVTHCC